MLHNFAGGSDGSNPWFAPLIEDEAGNLYGTTSFGGDENGVVFKLDPAGNETVLYRFTGGADGSEPFTGVVRDKAGNLYGTTLIGGIVAPACPRGCGVVFKLDPQGNQTVLYTFTGGVDGGSPVSNLVVRKEEDGTYALYSSTLLGGETSCGCGTIFKLTFPAGESLF